MDKRIPEPLRVSPLLRRTVSLGSLTPETELETITLHYYGDDSASAQIGRRTPPATAYVDRSDSPLMQATFAPTKPA